MYKILGKIDAITGFMDWCNGLVTDRILGSDRQLNAVLVARINLGTAYMYIC